MVSSCHIKKEIISSTNSTKTAAGKQVPGFFLFAKNWAQSLLNKLNF